MRLTRVHVPGSLASGKRQAIEGDAANHITRVLRLEQGDALIVFDGSGGEYAARIEEFRRGAVIVAVGERSTAVRESALSLTLAQGVSRGERMDWVVQKATELGVSRIVPVLTERTVVKLDARQSERKVQHWRGIAVAACEQSGRTRVPAISVPIALHDFLRQAKEAAALRLLLSPAGTLSVKDLKPPDDGTMVLIGPEGGLAESEQRAAADAGFVAVRMGPRVLRTETAAVAALTLLQYQFGDLVQ